MTNNASEKTDNLSTEQEPCDVEQQKGAAKAPDCGEEEKLKDEISSLKNQLLRSIADQENLRKRLEREKIDMAKYAVSNFAKELITIADNFERALTSIKEEDLKNNEVAKTLVDGVLLTETELLRVLGLVGVKKLEPKAGEKFDPNFHQAMFEIDHDELPKGHIAQITQIGYMHHDRLLRPAMVGVSKGKIEKNS